MPTSVSTGPSPSVKPGEAQPPAAQPAPKLARKARRLIAKIRRNPHDTQAVAELEAHYQEVGDHASLANLLAGWAETLSDGRAAADAMVRGADAALIGLGDRERAIAFLEHALGRCPAHEQALNQLNQLLVAAKDQMRLRTWLRRVAADLEGEPEHRAYLARVEYRLGRLYEDPFEQPGKAVLHYRRAIELEPTMLPAITAARRIYQATDNHAAVASLFEFQVRATQDSDDRVQLLMELSQLQRDKLGNHTEAVRALRKALQLAPANTAALTMLGEVLEARLAAEGRDKDAGRAAELYYRAAGLLPLKEAVRYLERAVSLDPDHARAVELLDELRGELGAFAPGASEAPVHAELPPPAPTTDEAASNRTQAVDPLDIEELEPSAPSLPVIDAAAPLPQRARRARTTPPPPPRLRSSAAPERSSMLPPPPDDEVTRLAPAPALEELVAESQRDSVEGWLGESEPEAKLDTAQLSAIDGETLSEPPPKPASGRGLREAIGMHRLPTAGRVPGEMTSEARAGQSTTAAPIIATGQPDTRPSSSPPSRPEINGLRERLKRRSARAARESRPPAQVPPAAHVATLPGAPAPRVHRTAAVPKAPVRARHNTPLPRHEQAAPAASVAPAVSTVPTGAAPSGTGTPGDNLAPAGANAQPASANAQPASVAPPVPNAQPASVAPPVANAQPASVAPPVANAQPASVAPPMHAAQMQQPPASEAQPTVEAALPPHAAELVAELPRQSGREAVEANIGPTTESNFYTGFDGHLQAGGIFIATYATLPLHMPVELTVTLPGDFVARALGRVRFVRDIFDFDARSEPGIGVQFEKLTPETLALFQRFADKRQPIFFDFD